jgi:tungstate transport system substrate-binding protein
MRLNRVLALLTACVVLIAVLAGCGQQQENTGQKETPVLRMATTTSTDDTGLLDYLQPMFEEETGIKWEWVAKGTGAAIEDGKAGNVDILLVHSKKAEEDFVNEGYGVERVEVMYNDFVIVGPEADPAGIKGMKDAKEALKKIAQTESTFISRGDDSGTHKKELSIWEKANITPTGEWYIESGQGMGDTLNMADEKDAYTLADRGTFLAKKDQIELGVVVEGDQDLYNQYAVIAINPEKYPDTNIEGANKFIEWITSPEVQALIGEYGVDKYGQPLFVPNARE